MAVTQQKGDAGSKLYSFFGHLKKEDPSLKDFRTF